jgi:hypothetical protein
MPVPKQRPYQYLLNFFFWLKTWKFRRELLNETLRAESAECVEWQQKGQEEGVGGE